MTPVAVFLRALTWVWRLVERVRAAVGLIPTCILGPLAFVTVVLFLLVALLGDSLNDAYAEVMAGLGGAAGVATGLYFSRR